MIRTTCAAHRTSILFEDVAELLEIKAEVSAGAGLSK